jgi:hypothetical protein
LAIGCFANAVLWNSSYGDGSTYHRLWIWGGRYEIVLNGGDLVLKGAPAAGASPAEVEARGLAEALQNNELEWIPRPDFSPRSPYNDDVGPPDGMTVAFTVVPRGPHARRLAEMNADETTVALLDALENPSSFAAAHVLLRRREDPTGYARTDWVPEEVKSALADGRPTPLTVHCSAELAVRAVVLPGHADVSIDASQLAPTRDYWRDRLYPTKGRMSVLWLSIAMGAAPVAWFVTAVRRAIRKERWSTLGLCEVCGYDVRSCGTRCSECGNPLRTPEPK